MADKARLRERREFYRRVYEAQQECYLALLEGKVKSYLIDDRQLTYHSLTEVKAALTETEATLDELDSMLAGKAARRAFGVVLRDW